MIPTVMDADIAAVDFVNIVLGITLTNLDRILDTASKSGSGAV